MFTSYQPFQTMALLRSCWCRVGLAGADLVQILQVVQTWSGTVRICCGLLDHQSAQSQARLAGPPGPTGPPLAGNNVCSQIVSICVACGAHHCTMAHTIPPVKICERSIGAVAADDGWRAPKHFNEPELWYSAEMAHHNQQHTRL